MGQDFKNKDIHEKFEKMVQEFAAENELTVERLSLRYSDANLNYSIDFKTTDTDDLAADFAMKAAPLGLDPTSYGALIQHPEFGPMTIIGINTRARKYKVQLETMDGKVYGFTVDGVRALLNPSY